MPSTRLVLKCFLLLAYLTVTAFLVADVINAFIVDGLTSPIPASRRPITSPTSDLTTNLASLREKILSAGLFASPREGLVKEGGSAVKGAEVAGKRVKLVGTMVATGRAPIAIVEDLVSKKQRLYRLHEQILDIGEVTEIHENGITVLIGGEPQFLPASIAGASPSAAVGTDSRNAENSTGNAYVRRIIDRNEVASSINDLPRFLSQARAAPYYENGNLNGWRIEALAVRSLFERIGLEAGDILQRVNGVAIRDPGMILTLLQQVKDENQVHLDLLRKKKKMTFLYEIR